MIKFLTPACIVNNLPVYTTQIIMPKRDFLFLDESGEPGTASEYYISGLIHLTDESLSQFNPHIGAMRYFGHVREELKSTNLDKKKKDQILTILRLALAENAFVKATALYVDKSQYVGPYLRDLPSCPADALKFRHLILRKHLEWHFSLYPPQSNEIELIIDRVQATEFQHEMMRNYLQRKQHNSLPNFLHIIQADSRYVEWLQIADWVSGVVKERYFTHKERDYGETFSCITAHQCRG